MLSPNNNRLNEIFKRLAEIANHTADIATDSSLTEAQKQAEYDKYFREHEKLTKEAQDILNKPTLY